MGGERFSEIVSDIYEAALLPSRWPDALARICRDLGFQGGAVATQAESVETWTMTPSMEGLVAEFAAGGWAARNERMERLVRLTPCSFVDDFDLFTQDEWASLPIYRDFLLPRGHGYGAGSVISTPGDTRMIIVLERLLRDGPVPAETISQLDRLRPHMARALVLLETAQRQQARTLLDSLSLVNVAAAIAAADGRITAANAEFETLDAQLPITARDHLLARDDCVRSQLREALAVPGAEAFVLHVLPLRRNARDIAPLGSAILMASRAMKIGAVDNTRLLRSLYDLTRSESKVALGILNGANLREIALREGVSYETVRSFAKSVYGKTGSDGQVDLVRRLSMLTGR